MVLTKLKFAVSALALVSLPVQAATLSEAFDTFEGAIADARSSDHTQADEDMQQCLSKMKEIVGMLRGSVSTISPENRSGYINSLIYTAELVEEKFGNAQEEPNIEMCNDVIRDLSIKLASRQGFGSAATVRGHLEVNVRTFDDSGETMGLIVGASPVALDQDIVLYRFPKRSSPTKKGLPPGRYVFVVFKNSKIVARERVDIGLSEKDSVDIDLIVP